MSRNIKRILFILCISIAIAGTTGWFFFMRQTGPQIVEFDIQRDRQEIMAIFDREWDWLIPGGRETFSPELMMAYRAPQQNPLYAGRLKIKVLREGDEFLGFVAWYMKSAGVGFLNFVAINPEYRGKGYAEKLVRYAMDQMIKAGAKKLTMVTWPHNVRARSVYDRVGWKVAKIDGQVHYEYYP